MSQPAQYRSSQSLSYRWFRGQTEISSSTPRHTVSGKKLTIADVQRSDNGMRYTCISLEHEGNYSDYSPEVTLNVRGKHVANTDVCWLNNTNSDGDVFCTLYICIIIQSVNFFFKFAFANSFYSCWCYNMLQYVIPIWTKPVKQYWMRNHKISTHGKIDASRDAYLFYSCGFRLGLILETQIYWVNNKKNRSRNEMFQPKW